MPAHKKKKHANNSTHNLSAKPIKKIEKKLVLYVTKKPYQSISLVTLLSSLVMGMGFAYYKFKHPSRHK